MNIFEFSDRDLNDEEKVFYRPFRLVIPKTGLMSIEDFISFCKNVAVLLSFSEETFQNGIADYLEGVGYYEEEDLYIPETLPTKEQINNVTNKILKGIENEKKFSSTKKPCDCGSDCVCEDREDRNRNSFDE